MNGSEQRAQVTLAARIAGTALLLLTFLFVAAAPPAQRRTPLDLLVDSVILALPWAIVIGVAAFAVLVWRARRG